jgi:polysaccharide deacetylase 2 family uncharacterized protein YibQ
MTREERTRGRRRRAGRTGLRFRPEHRRLVVQVVAGTAGVAAVVVLLGQLLGGGEGPPTGGAPGGLPAELAAWNEELEEAALGSALAVGLRVPWVMVHPPGTPDGDSVLTVVEFRVPGDLHMEVLNMALTRAVQGVQGEVVRGVELHDARVELEIAYRGLRTHRFVLQRYAGYRSIEGRIGLIVDDFGRIRDSIVQSFTRLEVPWTAAVIPEPGISDAQARFLAEQGIPLMVHLPMEPVNGEVWNLGDRAIYADTPPDRIKELLDDALAAIPGAKGINNHMGSRATTRTPVMRALMEALRERDLFFVDSRTTPESIGAEEAARAGVRWGARDIFLDTDDETPLIEEQFRRALEHARRFGSVIVIGHPRPNTLAVLQQWIPRAREQGFEFVKVDRLLRQPGRRE